MTDHKADEILDIVDANDRIIGKSTKAELHNNPILIHHTVHFTLFDHKTKRVLLTIRGFNKLRDAGKLCF